MRLPLRAVKVYIAFAYTLAAIFALPQLFLFTAFEYYEDWYQCVSIYRKCS